MAKIYINDHECKSTRDLINALKEHEIEFAYYRMDDFPNDNDLAETFFIRKNNGKVLYVPYLNHFINEFIDDSDMADDSFNRILKGADISCPLGNRIKEVKVTNIDEFRTKINVII